MSDAANSHTITGLQSGVSYSFLVIATTGSGASLAHSGAWVSFPAVTPN